MIREIEKRDSGRVCVIVNENWRTVYGGFVDPALLTNEGCMRRNGELVKDFVSKRLSEYVYEENGMVLGMISFGKTDESDLPEAFEVWRLYVANSAQGRGIGGALLDFAEQTARERGFRESVIWAFAENEKALFFYEKHGYAIGKKEYLYAYKTFGVRLLKQL